METVSASFLKLLNRQFKSYYVVWKQNVLWSAGDNTSGLNRTM